MCCKSHAALDQTAEKHLLHFLIFFYSRWKLFPGIWRHAPGRALLSALQAGSKGSLCTESTFPVLGPSTTPGQHNSSPTDLEQKQPQISLVLDAGGIREAVLMRDHVLESRLMKCWLKPMFLLYRPMHSLCAMASEGHPSTHQDTLLVSLTSLSPQWLCTHKLPHPCCPLSLTPTPHCNPAEWKLHGWRKSPAAAEYCCIFPTMLIFCVSSPKGISELQSWLSQRGHQLFPTYWKIPNSHSSLYIKALQYPWERNWAWGRKQKA